MKSKAYFNPRLGANALSVTSISTKLGAFILVRNGAPLLPKQTYNRNKNILRYFADSWNNLVKVQTHESTVCLGADVPQNLSETKAIEAEKVQQAPESKAQESFERTENKRDTIPSLKNSTATIRHATDHRRKNKRQENVKTQVAPHIKNHISRCADRNNQKHESLNARTGADNNTHHEMTFRPCLEYKMRWRSHKQKMNKLEQGEALYSDIIGTIDIPDILRDCKRYLISFIEVSSWYAYVTILEKRSNTPGYITKFLKSIQDRVFKQQDWFISEKAG